MARNILKRKRTWLLLVLLLTLGVGVYFEPSYCVRGWLHGEAFFEGRPTSYWRGVVVRDLQKGEGMPLVCFFPAPRPSWWQRCKDWVGNRPRMNTSLQLIDDKAVDVLREMERDSTPEVAGFAEDMLKAYERLPHDIQGRQRWSYWQGSINRYNLKHPKLQYPFFGDE